MRDDLTPLEQIDAEIARLERALLAVRDRIAATDAAIRSPRVLRSFERVLAFEATYPHQPA
jgi:hypothetical protein